MAGFEVYMKLRRPHIHLCWMTAKCRANRHLLEPQPLCVI